MSTRAVRIISEISREINRHSRAIEIDTGIRRIKVSVILDEHTGEILKTLYRAESQNDTIQDRARLLRQG